MEKKWKTKILLNEKRKVVLQAKIKFAQGPQEAFRARKAIEKSRTL